MGIVRHHAATAAVIVAALVGLAVALYNYFTPITGVTGTIGALVVIGSSLLVALAGGVLWFRRSGALAGFARVLGWLLALGTILAAWLLHEFWLVAAMAIALIAATLDFGNRGAAQ